MYMYMYMNLIYVCPCIVV